MKLWLDAHLPPALARWMERQFAVEVSPIRDLGLRDASDRRIFDEARNADAVVMTKDSDFILLLQRHGPPPKLIWITCGNTTNARLREVLAAAFPSALGLLAAGEDLVEVGDVPLPIQ